MKKKLLCAVLVFMLVILCGCSSKYDGWQTVAIDYCGSIKIPENWSSFSEDGVLYILDENGTPAMIQCRTYQTGQAESNKYYKDYKFLELEFSEGFSNSAQYATAYFLYDNKKFLIRIISLNNVYFAVWNSDIEDSVVRDIAESFEMN